ncbi:hypothetical protein ABZP36_005801, partial [Zizania latifolia]
MARSSFKLEHLLGLASLVLLNLNQCGIYDEGCENFRGHSNANGDLSSARVAANPDTHQDFQPTSKSSSMSFNDLVQDIKENLVLIYMKGYPDAPRCGFSALAVKVLQRYDIPISARDILGDPKLNESATIVTLEGLYISKNIKHHLDQRVAIGGEHALPQ